MKLIKNVMVVNLCLIALALILSGCDSSGPEPESSKNSEQTATLRPTSFKYGYDGEFGRYEMADIAEAYSGNRLVGKARAIELQETPTGGPKMMKIEVTHYSQSGQLIYKGYVYIQAGFSGGKIIKTEDISGKKCFTMFGSWPFGH